jgi:hypothetical protein
MMPIGKFTIVVLSIIDTLTVWFDGGMLSDGGSLGTAIVGNAIAGFSLDFCRQHQVFGKAGS